MDTNRQTSQLEPYSVLPDSARLALNRCNLPATLLGGLAFQRHPATLELDGIQALHQNLFILMRSLHDHAARARRFIDYMTVHFRLEHLEEAGLDKTRVKRQRAKADYLRMVRGWSFDSDGREGAVLKNWVETRFGLLTRHHAGPLGDRDSDARHRFLHQAAAGLYATNAIEAQLDLLYSYCQYELQQQHSDQQWLTLYRGINRIDEHEVLARPTRGIYQVLLNNLNSFTANRERADEFGDYILEVSVPLAKIFFFNRLLPGMLKGEDEYVVIGGLYEVKIATI